MTLIRQTAVQLAGLIRSRQLALQEPLACTSRRLAQTEAVLKAYLTPTTDRALHQLACLQNRLDQGDDPGPLAGIPLAVSDQLCSQSIKTTAGSRFLMDHVPLVEADVLAAAWSLGGLMMGKTNLNAFGLGPGTGWSDFGPSLNPLDLDRTSRGSAASLAAGSSWLALDSDADGSMRLDAARCGLTALKPSFGRLPRPGLIAGAPSLEEIGLMARNAADCGLLLSQLVAGAGSGHWFGDMPALNGVRILVPAGCLEDRSPTANRQALTAATRLFEAGGASVEAAEGLTHHGLAAACQVLAAAQWASQLERYDGFLLGRPARQALQAPFSQQVVQARTHGFNERLQEEILLGTRLLSQTGPDSLFRRARVFQHDLCVRLQERLKPGTVLLTPVCLPDQDPDADSLAARPWLLAANLSGLPAVVFALDRDADGLPVSVQLMGPPGSDEALLALADLIQLETGQSQWLPLEQVFDAYA